MKLAEFMRTNGITPERLAEDLGDVSTSGVRKWMSENRIPRKDQIEKIAELTRGDVLPNDFFSIPVEVISNTSQATKAGSDEHSAADPSGSADMEAAE